MGAERRFTVTPRPPHEVSLQPSAWTSGTLRTYRCQHCHRANEIRWVDWVPADYYNAVRDYVREAAGNESVLLPVSTLEALVPKHQLERAVANVMQLDLLRRCHEDRMALKQRVRDLEK